MAAVTSDHSVLASQNTTMFTHCLAHEACYDMSGKGKGVCAFLVTELQAMKMYCGTRGTSTCTLDFGIRWR
jgi:hypothetical protein